MKNTAKRSAFILTLLLPVLLLLAACGFTPLYAHGGDDSGPRAALQSIYIANIPDRPGQVLRNNLIDRFYTHGEPADPQYILTISPVQQHTTDLAISITSDATRAELRLTSIMTLKDKATGKILLQRDLLAVNAYNILSSEFTSLVSRQAVLNDALNDLAQQVETMLALYFNHPTPPPKQPAIPDQESKKQ